jgi:hypothetical protein
MIYRSLRLHLSHRVRVNGGLRYKNCTYTYNAQRIHVIPESHRSSIPPSSARPRVASRPVVRAVFCASKFSDQFVIQTLTLLWKLEKVTAVWPPMLPCIQACAACIYYIELTEGDSASGLRGNGRAGDAQAEGARVGEQIPRPQH